MLVLDSSLCHHSFFVGVFHLAHFCDGVSRRDFLRVGALGLGGLTLADILRLRAEGGVATKPRAVIMVCLKMLFARV